MIESIPFSSNYSSELPFAKITGALTKLAGLSEERAKKSKEFNTFADLPHARIIVADTLTGEKKAIYMRFSGVTLDHKTDFMIARRTVADWLNGLVETTGPHYQLSFATIVAFPTYGDTLSTLRGQFFCDVTNGLDNVPDNVVSSYLFNQMLAFKIGSREPDTLVHRKLPEGNSKYTLDLELHDWLSFKMWPLEYQESQFQINPPDRSVTHGTVHWNRGDYVFQFRHKVLETDIVDYIREGQLKASLEHTLAETFPFVTGAVPLVFYPTK